MYFVSMQYTFMYILKVMRVCTRISAMEYTFLMLDSGFNVSAVFFIVHLMDIILNMVLFVSLLDLSLFWKL